MNKLMQVVSGVLVLWTAFASADETKQISAASDAHAVLQKDVGVWDAAMTMWMSPQETQPVTATGVETNAMFPGGAWLVSDFSSEIFGEKFTGHGLFGYSPAEEEYVGTWIDSMSPYLMIMKGTYDADSETLTMFGDSINPQTGDTTHTKSVTKYEGDDRRVMTMYMKIDGTEDQYFKHMELVYTRRSN